MSADQSAIPFMQALHGENKLKFALLLIHLVISCSAVFITRVIVAGSQLWHARKCRVSSSVVCVEACECL